MKQYCRYCANCVYGDAVYCEILKDTMSEKKAKSVNKCKHFELNEIEENDTITELILKINRKSREL